jgi:tetratricopeptide (TPR) repeat protein
MGRYKRLAWISGGCVAVLVIVGAIWFYSQRVPHISSPLQVQARCGVAAGSKISGNRAQITCGLTTGEIEALIVQAVHEFDLPVLIDQAQKNQIKDLKVIEALSEKLGLTPEATLNILKLLKNPEPAPVPPAERLAVLIAPYTHIVVDREGPAIKSIPTVPEPPRASKEEMREEIKRVLAECAIAAGTGVELESIDIKCGPNEEELGAIIERVAVETNLAGLLKDLRQGISPDGNSLRKLVDELRLTQTSLLRLLTLLARSDTPPYQMSPELTALVKKHIALAQRVDDMRQDDSTLQNVSDQFYAAVAASDFTHAKALLRDYEVARSFKENADKIMADREEQHQHTLANMKKEESEGRNLLQAEQNKIVSELNEETKREAEKRVVLQQKLEQAQQQLAALEADHAAQKNQIAELSQALNNAESKGTSPRLAQAEDALRRDKPDVAETIYQEILAASSEYIAEAYYQIGALADGRQDVAAAYYYFNLARQVRPHAQKYTDVFGRVSEKVRDQWRQADMYSNQGKHAEAIALRQKILPLWESVWGPEHPRLADGLVTLANNYWAQRQYGQAVAHYQRAHQIWEAMLGAHHPQTADVLGALGTLYRLSRALAQSEQALKQAMLSNIEQLQLSRVSVADNSAELGIVYEHQGQLDNAVEMYKHASLIYADLGVKVNEAENYVNLASLYKHRGAFNESEAMYKQALTIFQELDRGEKVAYTHINLGELYRYRSDLKRAEMEIENGLAIYEKLRDQEGIANSAGALGNVYFERGNLEKAEAMYRKALEINEALGHKLSIAYHQGNLANVYSAQGDLDQAKRLVQAALETFETAGHEAAMAWLYGNLGSILKEQGKLDQAKAVVEKAITIYEKLGRTVDIAKSYAYLGSVYEARGDFAQAETMYRKALDINTNYDLKYEMAFNYRGLAHVHWRRGELEQTKAMFHNAQKLFEELDNLDQAKLIREQLRKLQ